MTFKTYINGLVYDKNNLGIEPLVRESLKTFYCRNLYIDSVDKNPMHSIIETSIDECIRLASESKFDFLILTWEGNIFDIHTYHQACIEHINSIQEEWLVSGQIIDQYKNRLFNKDGKADEYKNSFYLFPITAIVNLKKWKELGSPKWGDADELQHILEVVPSNECVHDDYTPLELNAGKDTHLIKTKPGWNIIDTSLRNGLKVFNLSKGIRNSQNYLYPENNVDKYNQFWLSVFMIPKLSDQYKKVLESILPSKNPRRIKDTTWQCFIKNTENYFPNEGRVDIDIEWSKLETYVFPASGFKDFVVCMSNRSNIAIKQIVHYDIIKQCLEIKEKIINRWSGDKDTFVQTLIDIGKEYRDNPIDVYHMHSMKDLIEAYNHLLKYFDNPVHLKKCWIEFQKINHSYVESDVLEDPRPIIELIKTKNLYLCLSDVAGWRNNMLGYGIKNLRTNIASCLEKINNNNISGYIDFKDPKTDQQMWQTINEAILFLK